MLYAIAILLLIGLIGVVAGVPGTEREADND